MNYITLNGYKSTLIKGLLISELPPITKPQQRTSIDEIDGRDGDIIAKLGYAAYDKKMTIGCYGDFSIDDIIQYFDSEGTVVFSNEPDKYYKYTILNQIDFERLCRFKKATVTFHVQPFKFSSVDNMFKHIVVSNTETSFQYINRGNVISRPIISIWGVGQLAFSINDVSVFSFNLPDMDYITINAETMNAYKGSTLKNRIVSCDYRKLFLKTGFNTISWSGSGSVNRVDIEKGSRWI